MVADVLRGQKRPLSERTVEPSGRHQTGDGMDVEAGQAVHPLVTLPELRDAGGREHEPVCAEEIVAARVLAVLAGKLGGHGPPDLVLRGGVGDVRDRVAAVIGGADLGDPGTPYAVRRIAKAGVIRGQ